MFFSVLFWAFSEEVLDALAREDLVGDLGEDCVDGEEGDAGAGDDGDDDAGGAQHLAERWPLDLPHLVRHPSPQIRRRRLLLPRLHHLLELLSHRCRGGGSCGVPLLYFLLLLLLSSLVGLRLLQGLGSAAVLLGGEAARAAGARETEGRGDPQRRVLGWDGVEVNGESRPERDGARRRRGLEKETGEGGNRHVALAIIEEEIGRFEGR